MAKILVATEKPFAPVAISGIKDIASAAKIDVALLEKYVGKAELLEAVKNVEAIIIRSDIIDKEVIDAADNLKIVVRAGAGYDNVDLEAASAKGVVVMNTPGQNANAVAELVFGLMLSIVRNGFNGTAGSELRGKKIGIHAYGNIGRLVNQIAKGFGMEVYAFDPFVDAQAIKADGVTPVETAEELYKTCQFISLHLPANEKTKGMINADLLNLMPSGAVLVNTARKEIIDEDSLLEVFKGRDDFKFASDIAPACKADIESAFAGRFFFTPKKMGAQTKEANINAGLAAAKQIVNFLEKGDTTFQVNK